MSEITESVVKILSVVKIFGLVLAVFTIGVAVCPKKFPRPGVVWAENAHWQNRVILAIPAIFLLLVFFWY